MPASDTPALEVLRTVAAHLVEGADSFDRGGLATIVAQDPEWTGLECTRRHVRLLWDELNAQVTAETGSPITRTINDWDGEWTPRIVVACADEFVEPWDADDPYGWLPLGLSHKREAGWDFPPTEEEGTWIGWWEPEAASSTDDGYRIVGTLTGFIVVDEGDLRFAHVIKRRRRTGIAKRLIDFARTHHELTHAVGPFTDDGRAFATSVGLAAPA